VTTMTRKTRPAGPAHPEVSATRRQIEATSVLAVVLRMAVDRGLPPLMWTVSDLGTSVNGKDVRPRRFKDGVEDHSLFRDPAAGIDQTLENQARRDTFEGYVALLAELRDRSINAYGHSSVESHRTELVVWDERKCTDRYGNVRLGATLKHPKVQVDPRRKDRYVGLLDIYVGAELLVDVLADGTKK
jgi:hypothetical protein